MRYETARKQPESIFEALKLSRIGTMVVSAMNLVMRDNADDAEQHICL